MTDIHSHILYGVDDGAQSLRESLAMLDAARQAGITRIIATPHLRERIYDGALIRKRYEELLPYALQRGMQLSLGTELHWCIIEGDGMENLRPFCLGDGTTLLIEFSMRGPMPTQMIKVLRAIQERGYQIIIAHPERFAFVQKDPSIARMWSEMDCALQLDVCELEGGLFSQSRTCAKRLLREGLYDYFASDAHCAADYRKFAKAEKRCLRMYRKYTLER